MSDILEYLKSRSVTPWFDCMIWVSPTERGYGRISLDGKSQRVHRVAWEAVNGPIPDGLQLDHLCRVRSCFNVEHLELVTGTENVRRGAEARRPGARDGGGGGFRLQVGRDCSKGHPIREDADILFSQGQRRCRACLAVKRERDREARALARAQARALARAARPPRALKTHCKHGHEFTPENTRIDSATGGRICRACRADTKRRAKARARAAKAAVDGSPVSVHPEGER